MSGKTQPRPGWTTVAISATVAAIAFAQPVAAQPGSSTASGTANATIVEPLTVSPLNPLQFGGIAVSAGQDGGVTIDAESGSARYTGSARAVCVAAGGCETAAARFHVSGESGRRYRMSLPASVLASRTDGPGPDLMVAGLVAVSANLPASDRAGLLDATGHDRIGVGGTLSIPAATPPGNYLAEIDLVLNYD